jgi:hypothetical protein
MRMDEVEELRITESLESASIALSCPILQLSEKEQLANNVEMMKRVKARGDKAVSEEAIAALQNSLSNLTVEKASKTNREQWRHSRTLSISSTEEISASEERISVISRTSQRVRSDRVEFK